MRYLMVISAIMVCIMAVSGSEVDRLNREGERLYAQQKYDAALDKFSLALVLDNRNEKTYGNLAVTLIRLGDYTAAISTLYLAVERIETINNLKSIYYNLALAYEKRGESSPADQKSSGTGDRALAAGYYYYAGVLFTAKRHLLDYLFCPNPGGVTPLDVKRLFDNGGYCFGQTAVRSYLFYNQLLYRLDEAQQKRIAAKEASPYSFSADKPLLYFAKIDDHLLCREFTVQVDFILRDVRYQDVNLDGFPDLIMEKVSSYNVNVNNSVYLYLPERHEFAELPINLNQIDHIYEDGSYIVSLWYGTHQSFECFLSFHQIRDGQVREKYQFVIKALRDGTTKVTLYRYNQAKNFRDEELYTGIETNAGYDRLREIIENVEKKISGPKRP